jgi:hypothetical protein
MLKSIVLFFLLLEANHNQCFAHDDITSIGIALGGSSLVSFVAERRFGDDSLRLNVGFFEFKEIIFTAAVLHYAGNGMIRPYLGAGVATVMIFPERKFGALHFLNIPAGVVWSPANKKFSIGAEGDINYFMAGRQPGGGKVSFKKDGRLLIVPGINCKYKTCDKQ